MCLVNGSCKRAIPTKTRLYFKVVWSTTIWKMRLRAGSYLEKADLNTKWAPKMCLLDQIKCETLHQVFWSVIKTGYTLDISNSYCKINPACLNISLFKWHYFHHNSSGKVVSSVKREGKSSFCLEKANPAGDEYASSLPCQTHQEGAARKTQQQQQQRGSPRQQHGEHQLTGKAW